MTCVKNCTSVVAEREMGDGLIERIRFGGIHRSIDGSEDDIRQRSLFRSSVFVLIEVKTILNKRQLLRTAVEL